MGYLSPIGFNNGIFGFLDSNILNGGLTPTYGNTPLVDDQYDWGFGDGYQVGSGSESYDKILQANTTAQKSGNTFWQKALMLFAVYGPNFVAAFKGNSSQSSQNDILSGNIDKTALQNYLAQTGGTGNPNDLPSGSGTENRQATVLGINTSTLVLVGFGFLAYQIFKPETSGSKRKR
jgi:hypothetical protein